MKKSIRDIKNGLQNFARNEDEGFSELSYKDSRLLEVASDGNLNMVKFLLEEGANVNVRDKYGYTPFMRAAFHGRLDVVKFLVEKGADVKGNDGWEALDLAVYDNHLNVVKFLVEQGADVNAEGKNGFTVLMEAARSGFLNIVKYLVRNGANVDARSKSGKTALDWAESRFHQKTTSFLKRYKQAVENRTEREFWEEEDSRSDDYYYD